MDSNLNFVESCVALSCNGLVQLDVWVVIIQYKYGFLAGTLKRYS
jgi:hypothetical protein